MGFGEIGEGGQEMFGEVSDDRNGDGIAHGAVGLVIIGGEFVGIRRSHEAGGFAGSD